jgi:ABC-type uncharacterized transport system permease subunit
MLSGVFFATAGFIVKLVPKVNPIQIVVTRFVEELFPNMLSNKMNLLKVSLLICTSLSFLLSRTGQ